MLFCFLHNHGGVCTVVRLFAGLYESTYLIVVFLVLLLSFKVYHMYTFLYKGPNSMVLHFFLRDCLLYKVNILFLMMDMSVLAWACPQNLWSTVRSRQQPNLISRYPAQMLAWACPQTLYPPSGHATMLRIFPARRRPRMKEPASGKQSQLDDEIAFRMQVCSFVKIPEKKVKNKKNGSTTYSCDAPCYCILP